MRYLIDGYNLLHAIGLARTYGGRAGWDRARSQLLDWLADRHGPNANDVTVALDAQNARGPGVVSEVHRGLRVMRKLGRSADDLIEDLVTTESSPATLTVVSNDARVRSAAARRRCPYLKCGEYVDALMSPARTVGPQPAAEKDESATPEEIAVWQKAFGG
ncbi:MAG TPA: NYN domain-containing protein [Gemmataceae bacterium]|jgi:predicted RNA-binding protein with PIN domain|nr:NYN domain-containing protein [Gemmataceae bacterium]